MLNLILLIRPNSGLILKIRPNACRHLKNLCKLGLRPKFGLRTKSDLFIKSPIGKKQTLVFLIHAHFAVTTVLSNVLSNHFFAAK